MQLVLDNFLYRGKYMIVIYFGTCTLIDKWPYQRVVSLDKFNVTLKIEWGTLVHSNHENALIDMCNLRYSKTLLY